MRLTPVTDSGGKASLSLTALPKLFFTTLTCPETFYAQKVFSFLFLHIFSWVVLVKGKNILLSVAAGVCLLGLCVYPAACRQAVFSALQTCGVSVIPGLFPFFVLTKLLTPGLKCILWPQWAHRLMQRLFGLKGECISPLLMSFLGGYPVGVSAVVSLYQEGALSKKEAEKALRLCNNSGPAFFVGIIAPALPGGVRAGLALYALHIFSALLTGLFFRESGPVNCRIRRLPAQEEPFSRRLITAVSDSALALLRISALILFFSVVLALAECVGLFSLLQRLPLGLASEDISAIVAGFLELTSGIVRLPECTAPFVLAAFFMGWGGVCVHLQAMSLWQESALQPKGFFAAKLLHGALSALLAFCLSCSGVAFLLCFALLALVALLLSEKRKNTGGNLLKNPL